MHVLTFFTNKYYQVDSKFFLDVNRSNTCFLLSMNIFLIFTVCFIYSNMYYYYFWYFLLFCKISKSLFPGGGGGLVLYCFLFFVFYYFFFVFLVYVFFLKSNKLHQTFPNPYNIFFIHQQSGVWHSSRFSYHWGRGTGRYFEKDLCRGGSTSVRKACQCFKWTIGTGVSQKHVKILRSGINRHLKNLDRDLDIVRDKIFRKANEVLDGKIKQNLRDGVSRPTKHKDVITNDDLSNLSVDNPVTLRYKV